MLFRKFHLFLTGYVLFITTGNSYRLWQSKQKWEKCSFLWWNFIQPWI